MSSKILEELRHDLGHEVQAHQAAVDAVDAAAAGYLQVNRTDLRCLEILYQGEAVLPSQLAAKLGLTTGSVTVMLDRLERLGYVTRSSRSIRPPQGYRTHHAEAARRQRSTVQSRRKASETYSPATRRRNSEVLLDFQRRSRELQERHVARIRQLSTQVPRRWSLLFNRQGLVPS